MIPKTVHYIWLGKKPKPIIVQKCIRSWYLKLRGFRIQCWNEDNLDLSHPFVSSCMERKLYAFAADIIRFQVLLIHGGIYLDTDMEVIESFDPFLRLVSFIGFEDDRAKRPSAGVIGGEANNLFCKKMVEYYDLLDISKPPIICDAIESVIKDSPICDLAILPQRTFYPYNPYSSHACHKQLPLMASDIAKDTVAVHHWQKSWRI